MQVYLVTYDGVEYELSDSSSEYQTLLESLFSGDGAVPLEYVFTRNAFSDKDDIVRISSKPRIVTIPVTVLGSSADSLMTGLKTLYRNIKVDKVSYRPMKIKVVSGSKTAYLDVYPYGEQIQEIAGSRGRVVSLSFIAPDPMWYTNGTIETTLRKMVTRSAENFLFYRTRTGADNTDTWLAKEAEAAGDPEIRAIDRVPWEENKYIVCGNFTIIDGYTRNHLCIFQPPNTFLPFVNSNYSFNNQSSCVKVYGNKIYFGGKFTQVNGPGIQANRVALYDGQTGTWSGLNSPITDPYTYTEVFAMDTDQNGNLYIGGNFNTTTGNYLLKYNGSAWSAPWGASSINNFVKAIAVGSNGSVYIGGGFSSPFWKIAKWTGSQWQSIGEPDASVYNKVLVLTFGPDGNLYAGGTFSSIGGVTAKCIAMWDGSRWYEIGGGVVNEVGTYPTTVTTIRFDERGNLYIAGHFTKAGGVPANSIAMWDGSRWHGFELTKDNTHERLYNNVYPVDQLEILIGASAPDPLPYQTGVYTKVTSPSPQKPTFKIYGPGYFGFILNATTGQRLEFDIDLLAGEVLTIDTEKLTAKSNTRGNMLPYLVPSSNFADFMLLQGDNYLTGYLVNDAVCILKNKYSTLGEAVG